VKSVAAKKQMGVNDALELVRQKDDEKREFLKYLFDRDINDPTMYHLVINSGRISIEDAIEMVAAYCGKRFSPALSDETKRFLKNRLLEKRAELLLHRLGIAHNYAKALFEAVAEGQLVIKGVVGGEREKKELFDALEKIPEITRIEDHLKVGTLSHLIY
jgi:hypothetical protein